MSRSLSRDVGGVVPFCALKIGPLSCFCLSLPQQSGNRLHRFHDDGELLEELTEEDEDELRVRTCERHQPQPFTPTQSAVVRRPSSGALELSRQLSRMSSKDDLRIACRMGSKEFSKYSNDNLGVFDPYHGTGTGSVGVGDFATGSASLGLGREITKRSEGSFAGGSSKELHEADGSAQDRLTDIICKSGELVGISEEQDESRLPSVNLNEVEEVRAFHEASREGRFLDALKEMDRLRAAGIDPSDVLGERPVERVVRITGKYKKSLQMFEAKLEDFSVFENNESIGVKWGIDVQDSYLHLLFEASFPEMDVVRAFAAVQERDLHKPFNSGLLSAATLGEETPHDSIWRSFTFSKTFGTKADNLTHISGVDALDEKPLHSLWAGHYNITEETAAAAGMQIPPVEERHERSSYSLTAYSLQPNIPRGGGDRSRGLRMRVLTEYKLSAVQNAGLSIMPSFAIRRLARSRVEKVPVQFKEFVESSTDLDYRLAHGERSEFYAMLRQRLADSET